MVPAGGSGRFLDRSLGDANFRGHLRNPARTAGRSLRTDRAASRISGTEASPMLDPELLRILVCPETKEPVHLAGPELLEQVNRAIEAGTLSNRSGEPVTEKVEAGLVREARAGPL